MDTDLHTQEHNKWDTEYPINYERATRQEIVCVRAGMGVGKTIAIRNMLKEIVPRTQKYYVSRSVVLSLQNCTATLRNPQAVSRIQIGQKSLRKTQRYNPEPGVRELSESQRRSEFRR
jgi:hypothetical protein